MKKRLQREANLRVTMLSFSLYTAAQQQQPAHRMGQEEKEARWQVITMHVGQSSRTKGKRL